MACPDGSRFTGFMTAMQDLDLWQAGYCMYATPLGEAVVGSVFYGAVSLGIFIRTGSLTIPAILYLILGTTITARMLSVVSPMVGLIILLVAPILLTALIWNVDRLG